MGHLLLSKLWLFKISIFFWNSFGIQDLEMVCSKNVVLISFKRKKKYVKTLMFPIIPLILRDHLKGRLLLPSRQYILRTAIKNVTCYLSTIYWGTFKTCCFSVRNASEPLYQNKWKNDPFLLITNCSSGVKTLIVLNSTVTSIH